MKQVHTWRLEQANEYLAHTYLVWWERELTATPENADDAHRPLDKSHDLAASLSYVETRQVRNDYTLRWAGKLYQIDRQAITAGLRKANVRVEARLDGSLAVRHGQRYLPVISARPAGKPGASFVPGEFATIPSSPLLPRICKEQY